jgi:hypothetical protein
MAKYNSIQQIVEDTTASRDDRINLVMAAEGTIDEKKSAIKAIESQKEPTVAEKALAQLKKVEELAKERQHQENIKKIQEGAKAVGNFLSGTKTGFIRSLGCGIGKIVKGTAGEFTDAYRKA